MKSNILTWVSLAIVVCNLYILSASRLRSMIRGVAFQGILISALPLLIPHPGKALHTVILVILSISIKGFVIPASLFRSIRDAEAVRDVDPAVGYSLSLIYGMAVSGLSFIVLKKIPFTLVTVSPFHASSAIAIAFTGIFIIVARRNVVSQIIGYLVFENAGFILAISVAASQPLFVEMGVLLDVLVGVFIMVMAVNRIHAQHDSISIRSLERLSK